MVWLLKIKGGGDNKTNNLISSPEYEIFQNYELEQLDAIKFT